MVPHPCHWQQYPTGIFDEVREVRTVFINAICTLGWTHGCFLRCLDKQGVNDTSLDRRLSTSLLSAVSYDTGGFSCSLGIAVWESLEHQCKPCSRSLHIFTLVMQTTSHKRGSKSILWSCMGDLDSVTGAIHASSGFGTSYSTISWNARFFKPALNWHGIAFTSGTLHWRLRFCLSELSSVDLYVLKWAWHMVQYRQTGGPPSAVGLSRCGCCKPSSPSRRMSKCFWAVETQSESNEKASLLRLALE